MPQINPAGYELAWRKAQISAGNGACVEAAPLNGMVAVRDSKNPTGPILTYTAAEWRAFLDGAKKGEFDDLC
jgi:predicted secreted Zn-dependent protease